APPHRATPQMPAPPPPAPPRRERDSRPPTADASLLAPAPVTPPSTGDHPHNRRSAPPDHPESRSILRPLRPRASRADPTRAANALHLLPFSGQKPEEQCLGCGGGEHPAAQANRPAPLKKQCAHLRAPDGAKRRP